MPPGFQGLLDRPPRPLPEPRFGSAGSRSRNTREGRGLRKEIARALTEVNARKIAQKPKKG